MTDVDKPHLRTVRSFVIRAGRTTASQQDALARLQSRFGLALSAGLLMREAVFGRHAPLVLEIGFGMGDSLLDMARAAPEQDFIGVEVHPPGVGNLLRGIEESGVQNLRVYRADANEVLRHCIADAALHTLQVFFPDPWHKKRHHKRRLIQPDFVATARSKLEVGGTLHLATDWQPYAEQMLAVMEQAPGFSNVFGGGNWATEHRRPETKFERRGQRLGHGVWDLIYRREQ